MNLPFYAAPEFLEDLTSRLEGRVSGALEWLIQTNGDSDPYDSVILVGFEGAEREPSLAVKVPRMAENAYSLRAEYQSLNQLWFLLGAEAEYRLPRPIDLLDLDGQPALVLSFVRGENLARMLSAGFWHQEHRVLKLAQEAGRSLRALHESASILLSPGENPYLEFKSRAAGFQKLFPLSDRDLVSLLRISTNLDSRTCKVCRKVLIQGDFWHGNLIRARQGLIFVDWQFAHWSGDVSMDLYLFILAAALSACPQGSQAERAHNAAQLLAIWRSQVIPAYLMAYGQPEGYLLLPPKLGMLAACVEKAVRPVLDFGYSHPDDRMWKSLYSEIVNWPDDAGGEMAAS